MVVYLYKKYKIYLLDIVMTAQIKINQKYRTIVMLQKALHPQIKWQITLMAKKKLIKSLKIFE